MGEVFVDGWLATTGEIPERDFRLSRDLMDQLCELALSGALPIGGHHDPRQGTSTRVVRAEVRRTPDGEYGVWAQLAIDENEWRELGSVKGFSVSFFEGGLPGWTDGEEPVISVAADAYHWADENIVCALDMMSREFSVRGRRLHQLAGDPPAKVILEMAWWTLVTLGPNIVASAIWDGLKHLFSSKKTTTDMTLIQLRVQNGEKKCSAVIETSDEFVARKGIETISEAMKDVFDDANENQENRVLEYRADADRQDDGKWNIHR